MVGLALLGPAAPASAATKPCVGVVVDGRLAGGGLRTSCAKGDPDSGLEALTMAGVGYAFVPRQPGQICQLDGFPECSRNSADTYWSYWWRAPGSSRWVYATEGAGGHDPEPGAVEAWVWQEGGRQEPPDIAFATLCPQATTTQTTKATRSPTPAAEPEPIPDTTRTKDLATPGPASSSTKPTTSATSTPPTTSTSTTSPAPSTDPTTDPATTSPAPSSSNAATEDDDGGGPPLAGLAIGTVLVAVLGGAALARSRRTGGSP